MQVGRDPPPLHSGSKGEPPIDGRRSRRRRVIPGKVSFAGEPGQAFGDAAEVERRLGRDEGRRAGGPAAGHEPPPAVVAALLRRQRHPLHHRQRADAVHRSRPVDVLPAPNPDVKTRVCHRGVVTHQLGNSFTPVLVKKKLLEMGRDPPVREHSLVRSLMTLSSLSYHIDVNTHLKPT